MDNSYNETANRLWEKIEYHKDKFSECDIDFSKAFPVDQLTDQNPFILDLVKEVEEEYQRFGMTEFQCSWAVMQAFGKGGGVELMERFNKANGTNLSPRA